MILRIAEIIAEELSKLSSNYRLVYADRGDLDVLAQTGGGDNRLLDRQTAFTIITFSY